MTTNMDASEVIQAIDDITADHEDAVVSYEALAEWWNGMRAGDKCQLVEERLGRKLVLSETFYIGGFQL